MKHISKSLSARKLIAVGLLFMLATVFPGRISRAQPIYYCQATATCALAWSPSETSLLAVLNQYGLWLYDADDPDSELSLIPYENATSLSFDPSGTFIAVTTCNHDEINASCNGTLVLFDLEAQAWETIVQYDYGIGDVKFSPDGKYIAFRQFEPNAVGVRLIDLATEQAITISDPMLTFDILDYAIDPLSTHIAISIRGLTGHLNSQINVWRLSDQMLEVSTEGIVQAPALTFAPDGTGILFTDYDTKLSMWDLESGVITANRQLVETNVDNLNYLRFTDDSRYLVASLYNGQLFENRKLFVGEVASGEEVFAINSLPNNSADAVSINPVGTHVAYITVDGDEQMWVNVWERSSSTVHQMSLKP